MKKSLFAFKFSLTADESIRLLAALTDKALNLLNDDEINEARNIEVMIEKVFENTGLLEYPAEENIPQTSCKYKVEYGCGTGKRITGFVDYMKVNIEGTELYAETKATATKETYTLLRELILSVAAQEGITEDMLHFYYD